MAYDKNRQSEVDATLEDEAAKAYAEKLEAERKAKFDAMKATIGKCPVCMLDLAYVDNFSEERKDNPIICPSTAHVQCAPIRESQKNIEKLTERVRALEVRVVELQRFAMDRAMPLTERVRSAIDNARAKTAHAFHVLADVAYPRTRQD